MENNYSYVQEAKEKQDHIIGGIVGALIGAVIGAVIWAVVGVLTDTTFWLIGLAIGAIVAFGYDLLKGRQGPLKIITIVVCVILAVFAGDIGYTCWNINAEYNELNTLLTSGTDDEIAQYFFTADAYEEYKTLNPLDKKYNIRMIRDEYQVSSLVEFYNLAYKDNSEFKSAFMKDMLFSIAAALFSGLSIAFKSNKKNETPKTVNFEEAGENPEATAEEDTNAMDV